MWRKFQKYHVFQLQMKIWILLFAVNHRFGQEYVPLSLEPRKRVFTLCSHSSLGLLNYQRKESLRISPLSIIWIISKAYCRLLYITWKAVFYAYKNAITTKDTLCPGTSETSNSPLTRTFPCNSSFKHFCVLGSWYHIIPCARLISNIKPTTVQWRFILNLCECLNKLK